MTNREKIEIIRNAQEAREEIETLLVKVIRDTYDYHCYGIDAFGIKNDHIDIWYQFTCRGDWGRDNVTIPVEWLDEGFDYVAAYREQELKKEEKRKAEETKRKEEEERRKKEEEARKAKKEYEEYLKLKEKYESKGVDS